MASGERFKYVRPDGSERTIRCSSWTAEGGALFFWDMFENLIEAVGPGAWALFVPVAL